MAIQFDYTPIPGVHGPILMGLPELQVTRTKFQGVRGTSEIMGETGGREIFTRHWLYGGTSTTALMMQLLRRLETMIGKNAALVITAPGIPATFNHCTFLGFEKEEPGILPDLTGQLGGNYWCPGTLRWYQLSPWDDNS